MHRRILVVEDHRDNRESLALLLAAWGYEVALAEDGEQGIALAATWRPDVVILDLGLPGVQGEDTATIIKRSASPTSHIIAYTGFDRLKNAALRAGCDAFVLKPGLDTLAELLVTLTDVRALKPGGE